MLSFLQPKSKLQVHTYREIPIESLRILGIAQVNPYYSEDYQSDKLITLVCFANESKDYDEKEAMVLTSYFALRRCPRAYRRLPISGNMTWTRI